MPKAPLASKLKEYDEGLRFCKVVVEILQAISKSGGEQSPFPADFVQDSWRRGSMSFGGASRSVTTLCREFLEMTRDYEGEALVAWDQMLTEQSAVALSAMRARHWKLIPKILKRARIRNDAEFYLVKTQIDSSAISEQEQTSLMRLVEAYELEGRE